MWSQLRSSALLRVYSATPLTSVTSPHTGRTAVVLLGACLRFETLRRAQVRLLPFPVSLTMSESEKHQHAADVPVLHASESAYVLGPGTVMGSGEPVKFVFSSLSSGKTRSDNKTILQIIFDILPLP